MLSMRLKEKWHAIIATAGAARRSTTGRSGPVVSAPAGAGVAAISGGLSGVACYQHERVVVALQVARDHEVGDFLRRVGQHQRFRKAVADPVGKKNDGVAERERDRARGGMR